MSTWKRNAGLVALCTLMVGVSATTVGWAAAAPAPSSASLKSISSAVAADQFDLAHLSTKRVFDPTTPAQKGLAQAQALKGQGQTSRGIVRLQASSGRSVLADLSAAAAADPSKRVMWAASSEGVDLSWAALSGVFEYRVSKGGKFLTIVRGTHYRDQGVLPGAQIEYVVQSVSPAKSRIDFPGRTWGLSVSVPKVSSSDAVGMQAAAVKLAAAVKYVKYSTAVYETFIPQKYIMVPPAGCEYRGYDFTGDNRGFGSGPGSSYKTSSNAVVDWNRRAVYTSNNVGASHVVDRRTKKLVATRTASASGLSVTKTFQNDRWVSLAFRIRATIPFCKGFPSNSIQANFNLTMYKSGSYLITEGWHKLMPNHVLWLTTDLRSSWIRAYAREWRSPVCLLDTNASWEWCRANMGGYTGKY